MSCADGTTGHRVQAHIIDLGPGNSNYVKNQSFYEHKEKEVVKCKEEELFLTDCAFRKSYQISPVRIVLL